MNNIYIPAFNASYIDLKVYNIFISADISSSSLVTIVASDVFSAVQIFAYLYPDMDIANIVCVGPCVSLFPLSLAHE